MKDVQVTAEDGTVSSFGGTFRLTRLLPSGQKISSECVFDTQSGVDLLGGTYEVETTAKTPGGLRRPCAWSAGRCPPCHATSRSDRAAHFACSAPLASAAFPGAELTGMSAKSYPPFFTRTL